MVVIWVVRSLLLWLQVIFFLLGMGCVGAWVLLILTLTFGGDFPPAEIFEVIVSVNLSCLVFGYGFGRN